MEPLISSDDLALSLTDVHVLDEGLAQWAVQTVSDMARDLAGRQWTAEDVPGAARAIIGLAARRLYANPDRFVRETTPEYGYALDPSVTSADIFTPTEQARLRRFAAPRRTGGLTTISTTREPLDGFGSGDVYVPDGTTTGFPWYGV